MTGVLARIVALPLLVCLAVVCMPRVIAAARQGAFRVRTEVVALMTSVTRNGRPVLGLTNSDFEVRDNGVPQSVTVAPVSEYPLDVVFVIGGYPSDRRDAHARGIKSLEALTSGLRSSDSLSVVLANEYATLQEAQKDAPTDLSALKEAPLGVSLFDAVFLAVARPEKVGRRPVVLVLSDGWDTWSTIDGTILKRVVARSSVALFGVFWSAGDSSAGSGGGRIIVGSPSNTEWLRSRDTLEAAITLSGGVSLQAESPVSAVERLLEEIRTYYWVSYSPNGVPESGWHDVKVSLPKMRDATVRSRNGYER